MKHYRIEAYPEEHSGRALIDYASGINAANGIARFKEKHPEWTVKAVWEFVPPDYWSSAGHNAPATFAALPETDPNNHMEDKQ